MQTPLDEFPSENSEESYERGVFLQSCWRCAKKFFIKRLFNCSGVFEKKFLSSEIRIHARLESEKKKIGEIWSIIHRTFDEEKP
tara:strand:+ start:84 stop:335 length:252 start_codon:yes stop_codon:yes gene_type:complete